MLLCLVAAEKLTSYVADAVVVQSLPVGVVVLLTLAMVMLLVWPHNKHTRCWGTAVVIFMWFLVQHSDTLPAGVTNNVVVLSVSSGTVVSYVAAGAGAVFASYWTLQMLLLLSLAAVAGGFDHSWWWCRCCCCGWWYCCNCYGKWAWCPTLLPPRVDVIFWSGWSTHPPPWYQRVVSVT